MNGQISWLGAESDITTNTRPESRKERPGAVPQLVPRGTGGAGCRSHGHTICPFIRLLTQQMIIEPFPTMVGMVLGSR